MLQSIRDRLESQKWLTYVVLGALAVIFAAWGAYGVVNLSFGGATYAAKADGDEISIQDARNAWQRQQAQWQQRFGGDIPAQEKSILQDQMLESMVRDLLVTQRAHNLGYRVSDDDLIKAIQAVPRFQIAGQYSPDAAKLVLSQMGVSLPEFETEMRSSLQREQLEGAIGESDFATPREVDRMRSLQDQQREVRYALLPADKFGADAKIDDAAVQAYYKAHAKDFMTPETAHIQYGDLRLGEVAAQQTVSDEDLHAAYDKNKSKYVEPERRKAAHILIAVADQKEDAAALKLAQQVLAEAKAGKDFGQLAKQYSKDSGSADKGGELDPATREDLDKPFADALFSMKPGEITGPVKTQYGYHIIKLEEIEPGHTRTFDEARPELEAELKRDRAGDRFGEIQEQLQTKLQDPGTSFDDLAKEYHLQTGDLPQFQRGPGTGPLAGVQPAQDLVFGDSALGVGKAGGPVLAGEDRLIIIKVLDRKQPQLKPLAEVRDGIVADLRKQAGTDAALKAAQAATAKLDAGASFDEVTKELGVTAEPAKFISRGEASVPAQVLSVAFSASKPAPAGKAVNRAVKLTSGGAALLTITNVRTKPDDQNNPQADRAYARQAAGRIGEQEIAAYIDQLRATSSVKKNLAAFD
jgi:peptidyl-prolyl cis-trans isomerase D